MASYPILYPASVNAISDIYNAETDSYALGYGALSNAISTSTVSSINDSYEFSMEYPVEDSFLFQNLVVGNKILAEHDCTGDLQLFEIRDVSNSLEKDVLNVECVHVSYATDGIVCCPDQTMMKEDDPDIKKYSSFVECTSLQAASKWITDNAKGVNPFTLDVTAHYGNHLHNSRIPLTEEAFDRYYHANQYYINNSSVLEVTAACPAPCLGRTKLWGNNSWTLSIDLKGGPTATIRALYFEKEDSTEPVRNVVVNTFDTTLSWQRFKTDEIVGDASYPYVIIQINGIGVEARLWMLEETRVYSGHWEETNNDKYWRFQSAPITYRKALNGDEDTSLVGTYGGELLFDNYTIRLLSRIGEDRGLTIRYAKNLQDLTDDTDGTNIFGGIVPYYTDGNGTCHWFGSKGSYNGKADGIVYSDWYDPTDPLRRRLCILDVTEHFSPEYDQANKVYQDNIDAAQAEVTKYSNELTRISARLQAYNEAQSKAEESGGSTYASVSYEIDGITYTETAGPYNKDGWTNQINIMTVSQNENTNWHNQAQSILEKAQKDQEKMKTWEPNLSAVISYCKAYMNENNSHRALRNLEVEIQNEDPEIGLMNADIITLGDTATVIGDMYPADYSGGYWTDYIPTVPNMDYVFYGEPSALRIGDQVKVLWYDENKVVIDNNWTITATKEDEQRNHIEGYYICPNGASYVRVCWPKFWGTDIADLGFMHNGIDDLPNTSISEVPGDTPMQYISRVIELDWNMLEGCYNSITLGDAQEKLTNILTDGVSSAVGRANAIIMQAANNIELNNVSANNSINKIDAALTEARNNLTKSIKNVSNATQEQFIRSDEEIQRINARAAEIAENVSAQAEQIREVIQEATNITEELHDSVDSLSADILAVAQDADALSEELTQQMQAVDTNIADIQSRIDGVVALSDDMQAQINELELGTVDPETLAEAIETVKADIPTDEKIQQLASLKDEELAAVITAYVQNGYVSNEALAEAGYATELWVEGQDFATELWVEGKDYATETYADGKASTAKSEAISAAASDATTKANNAKSSAISTAAADATTKANNAKSSAISTAAADATAKADAAEASAKAYSDTLKSDLQTQIDGKIETFAQDADPSTSWTTSAIKTEHTGDIWYCTKSSDTTHYQKTWRWTGTAWVQISAVPDSILDKIDGKAQIFYQTTAPTSGMNAKDYWIDSDADGKPTYIYYNNQWVKVSDYNAAIAAAEASAKAYSDTLKTDLQTQIDGKIETFAQDADPSTSWKTAAAKTEHTGDIWYCTKSTDTTHYQKTWRWTGSAWVQISVVPDSIIDKIDGKAQIFYQASAPTSGMNAKDYWIDSDADGKPTYIYYNNQWIKVSDYNAAIAAAKSEAISTAASDAASKAAAAQAAAISAAAQDASTKAQSARENAIIDTKAWVNNQDYATETYADGKASTAKSEAISAAATDATTKANNAQSTAISTAAADATSKANAAEAAAKAYADNLVVDLEADIDGKISTYAQAVDPSTGWPTSDYAKHAGDIWYCTDSKNTAKYQLCWRWTGSAWTAFSGVPDTVIDKIDGKTTTFYQNSAPTSGMQKNDIWIDADDANKASYIYSGSAWIKASDYNVGGRNYLQANKCASALKIESTESFTLHTWASVVLSTTNLSFLKPNTTYTFSYTATMVERTALPTFDDENVGFYLYSASTGSARRDLCMFWDNKTEFNTVGYTETKSFTFTTPTTLPSDYLLLAYTRRWTTNGSTPYGFDTIRFDHVMFEEGNIATDWSPAPEDVEADATTKANNAQSTAISTAAADATTKANNAQSTAISTAAADATTKANNAKSSAISETKTWVNQQGFGSANDIATLRASLLETTNTVASNKTELLAKFDNYVATGDLNDAITRTDIMQATEASMYDLEFAQGKYLARKCRLVMPNAWGAGGKTKERSVEQRPGGTATWLPYSKLYYWYTSDVSIGTLADADLWWQYDEDWYSSASVARQIAAYKFKDSDGVMHISDPCTMIQCRFNTSNYPSAIQAHIWNFTLQDVEWNNYNTSSARPTSWTYHAQIDTANVSTATSGTESYAYITRESMDLVFTLSSAGALKVKMYYISDRFCPQASAYNGNKVTKRWQVGSDSTQLKYMFLSELGDQFQLMWEEFFYQRSGTTVFISSMSTDANWNIGTIATWSAGGYNTNAGQTTIYAWAELYDGTSPSTNKYKGMYCPFKVVCWVESGKLKAMVPHMRRQYEDYADAHGWPDRNLGFNSWFLGWGQINGLRDGTGLYES